MKVLVTGATGFLGSWIVRELLRHGHAPRVLIRRGSRLDGIAGLEVEPVAGDLLDQESIDRATRGMEAVIHAAGQVSARGGRAELRRVNVGGTRSVLDAAARYSLRVIYTSTIATLGTTYEPVVRDEEGPSPPVNSGFGYVDTKREAEELARLQARRGQEVVILNPGIILGPGDVYFTSTRIVLEYLRGTLRFYPRGGISFCDVREVAAAHVAALTRGRRGERYILAGENVTYAELFARLRRMTGLPPAWPMPWWMAPALVFSSEVASVFGSQLLQEAVESMRYGQRFNFRDSAKARRELGYASRPLEQSLRDTVLDELVRGVARASTPELLALRP